MWGVIFGVCLLSVSIGLRVEGKINDKVFVILLIAAGIGGFLIVGSGSIKRLKAGPSGVELETFQRDVNAVKAEALDEIKSEVVVQKEAISRIIREANDTREALQRVAESAAPPMLSLQSKEVIRVDKDYMIKLEFRPSKNTPFGYLSFHAEIIGNSGAVIKRLNPYDTPMTYGGPGEVSDEGKKATLWYVPIGSLWQRVALIVSEPCTVHIKGNRLSKDLELEIK